MAPLHSKRRKLSHYDNDGSSADQDDHSDQTDENSSVDMDDEVPIVPPKKLQVRQKRANGDDSAIYAGGDYKSSLFKLQVDELLAEVQPDYEKRLRGVDEALRTLKGLIESIAERDAVSISEATKSLQKSHKIAIPFPDPRPDPDAPYKLAYAKPSNINVVGSYVLKTMVKSEETMSVDMVVVMPTSIFQDKDYLNYRYFYKRAYYLACIVAGLQPNLQEKFIFEYKYLHGNTLLPILSLKPKTVSKSKSEADFEIKVIVAAQTTCFPESKLRPDKNCVRPNDRPESNTPPLLPTPFYNSSIRSNCNYEAYLKVLHASSKQSNGFKNACILGRIWLRQRGFSSSLAGGGFGHFEWSAMTALLLKGGGPKGHSILSSGYSSYQMFKAVLQFLATHDLINKPVFCGVTDTVIAKSNVPMLYDGERGQNLLYKMFPWTYAGLRDEAQTSLKMLNDAVFDSFESTFILRSCQPLQKYDCLFQIAEEKTLAAEFTTPDHVSKTAAFSRRLYQILQEGLTDRVKLINIEEAEPLTWSTKSVVPSSPRKPILVSVVFDPANIDRVVDHGPAAEEKKLAAKFQKFWGAKAELRRFKDGSILESLIWSAGSAYTVFKEIVSYLVKRHLAIDQGIETITGESFEKLLPGPGTNTSSFESLKESFRVLEKQIRDLDSLPLQLRQLSATSPQLRYSSIDPPLFSARTPLKTPADIFIQFEGSGRWPDDVIAIQRTKIAFLLRIGVVLEEGDRSVTTRVGLENDDRPLQNCAYLDIAYESGAAFRLRIHNDREQTLLERQVKDKSIDQHSREDAVSALSIYKKTFIQLPLLTQSVGTHCTRFPLLSPTIRLVKMWFDRHMLMPHISDELVELLVSRTFLQPYPWAAPSSVMTGFLRTLHFISKWDWRSEALIVDFTGTMTSHEVDGVNTRLEAWRKIDPGMVRTVIFAASNHDLTGTAFTDVGPSKMVAARMTALARSACKLIKEKGLELDNRALFASSVSDYDFVVHLSPKFTGAQQRQGTGQSKFKNIEVQSDTKTDLIGYEPVRLYINELEKIYGNSIVFFYGALVGSTIAGLWNPQITTARTFKVNLAHATKTTGNGTDGKAEIELDKTAILSEIGRLGGDMVARIEVNR